MNLVTLWRAQIHVCNISHDVGVRLKKFMAGGLELENFVFQCTVPSANVDYSSQLKQASSMTRPEKQVTRPPD